MNYWGAKWYVAPPPPLSNYWGGGEVASPLSSFAYASLSKNKNEASSESIIVKTSLHLEYPVCGWHKTAVSNNDMVVKTLYKITPYLNSFQHVTHKTGTHM